MDSLPVTPPDRDRLRARASHARERARSLVEEYAELRAIAQEGAQESRALVDESTRAREVLRSSVAHYVRLLRAAETPPERAIMEIKAVVREALPARADGASEVMADVVRWSIRAYYSPS